MPFGFPGSWEWVLILIVALLVFGKRLPEVMRSMGKSIVEFKKGIKDIEDEIERESSLPYRDRRGVKDEFYEGSEERSVADDNVSRDEMEAQERSNEVSSDEESDPSEESKNSSTPDQTSSKDGKVSV